MSAASLINALGFGHGRQTKKPEYATPTVDARLDVIPAAAPYFPKARNLYLSVTIDENAFAKLAPGATIQGVVAKLGKTTVTWASTGCRRPTGPTGSTSPSTETMTPRRS
jgi:hypothetical protein